MVLTSLVLNLIITAELGANPVPVIVTLVPTAPELGLSEMADVTVNVFEAELSPWVASTVLDPRDD